MLKLNIGCGGRQLDEYINIDLNEPNTIHHDCKQQLPFEENDITEIFSSHFIEHLWVKEFKKVLQDWKRVLKPKGRLVIWTPDYDVVHAKRNNIDWFQYRMFSKAIYPGSEHHAIYNFEMLKKVLEDFGFVNVVRLDIGEFPWEGVHEDMNMGVCCFKN